MCLARKACGTEGACAFLPGTLQSCRADAQGNRAVVGQAADLSLPTLGRYGVKARGTQSELVRYGFSSWP